MGEVIRFPFERRDIWSDAYHPEPAKIFVLPVIRVEREQGLPLLGSAEAERCRAAFAELTKVLHT